MALDREQALGLVQEWFGPAFGPGETLLAALAATTFRPTILNSLVGAAKDLTGHSQARVLLLTDRAVHIAGRHFWRRRFRTLYVSYPRGSVSIRLRAAALWIGDEHYYLNPVGMQLARPVGSELDINAFLGASST